MNIPRWFTTGENRRVYTDGLTDDQYMAQDGYLIGKDLFTVESCVDHLHNRARTAPEAFTADDRLRILNAMSELGKLEVMLYQKGD